MSPQSEQPDDVAGELNRRWLVPTLTGFVAMLTIILTVTTGIQARQRADLDRWVETVESQGLQVHLGGNSRVEVAIWNAGDVRKLLQMDGPYPDNLSIACGGCIQSTHDSA